MVSVVANHSTARMRESLNIFEVLTDFIYDSAWASDHYALVRVHHYEVWKEGPLRIYRTKKAYSRHNRSRQTRLVDQVKQSLVIHE